MVAPQRVFWAFGYILPLVSSVVLYFGLEYAQKEIRVMERASQVLLLETPKMYKNF